MANESGTSHPETRPPNGRDTRWPPPGLERLQGDLGRVAARGALGGGILVLPLLFVIAAAPEFATLGPLGDAWWVSMTLAVIGLAIAVDALARTMTLLRRVASALDQGYDRATILSVLADNARDMGFLLTGSRHFSVLSEPERRWIARARLYISSLLVAAAIWLFAAFAAGLLLASRGVLSPTAFWMSTALPPLVMYLLVGAAKLDEERRLRRARRAWFQQPWAADLASQEAREWRAAGGAPPGATTHHDGGRRTGRAVRYSAVLVALLAVLVSIPTLTLVPTSAVGPILAVIATPSFDNFRTRAARAEALRSYTVPADPAVDPAEAGRLLHDLLHVGAEADVVPGERAPSRLIREPWTTAPDRDNPMGLPIEAWDDSIMVAVTPGLTADQRAYLAGLASHPAREAFSTLARAGAIDIAGARYAEPVPEGLSIASLPLPRFSVFRTGAYTHLGVAALELADGRPDRAEELVREVISVGFLLGDGGATVLDNIIGYALVDSGARALLGLYDVTGRTPEHAALSTLMSVAERAAAAGRIVQPADADAWVSSLPAAIADTTLARGLRWEYFISITSLTPCLNLHRIVFGPGEEYPEFVERARRSLVAWPSEEPIFELASRGWFGSGGTAAGTWIGRLLSTSMYRGAGGCGELIRELGSMQALL